MQSPSSRAPLDAFSTAFFGISITLSAVLTLPDRCAAQGFYGLGQECQFPNSNASLDTPTPSIACNYNWIVEVCNSQIAVWQNGSGLAWSKVSAALDSARCGQSFFGAIGATRLVDNKVLVDQASGRFCVMGMQQDTFQPGLPGLYVAWSDSNYPLPNTCPNGRWHMWRTPVPTVPAAGVYQPDFNGMGQTDTHFIYSGILQPVTNPNGPSFTFIRVFEKANLSAWPGTPNYQDFVSPTPRLTSEFLHAADSWDPGAPNYLAAALVSSNRLRLVHANLSTGNEDEFLLNVPSFVPASGAAPQPGGFLDTIDGRMQSAVYRDGYLYCCHTILINLTGSSRHAIRWYQIAMSDFANGGTPALIQSGVIDLGIVGGQSVHAFMPALAVNQYGDLGITYARSSSIEVPGIGLSTRRSFDPIGTMNTTTTLQPGQSSYLSSVGTGSADRWGDWSSIVIDRQNPITGFIACGSIARAGGTSRFPQQGDRWATWIEKANILGGFAGWRNTYGVGTTGTGGAVPTWSGFLGRPRIGQNFSHGVSNTTGAPTVGACFVSLAAANGTPTPFGPAWVDLAQATTISFMLSPTEGQVPLPIPMDPAFIGTSLFLQAAIVDDIAANDLAVTGGLEIICGS